MTKLASLRGFEDGRHVVGEADYFVAQGGQQRQGGALAARRLLI
jgi:hypothetical protein